MIRNLEDSPQSERSRAVNLLRKDIGLHCVRRSTIYRLRLSFLTVILLAAQWAPLTSPRLSMPCAVLIAVWVGFEITLRWLSE